MGEPTGCSHRDQQGHSIGPDGICPSCLLELGLGKSAPVAPAADGPPAQSELPTVTHVGDRASGRLAIGRILGDRYRIESRLGSGAMGEVWRAADLKLRVEVALKALPSRLVGNPKRREMMRSEVRSAREVISPNVCRIYDLVEADGQELISMEYIDGVTLSEYLRREGPLELQEASEIGMQLLAGLEAIHQSGFVHRDIKPENIMITRAGRVVTMDFGIAKPVAEGQGGTIAGTPAYMAPEQRRGDKPDPRWDLFSAGIVLAEMLVAKEESEELLRSVREEPPRLPESPWRSILERAIARRSDQRYPSARSLGQALEEVTLRISVAEDRRPYPGLSSFQKEDAEFFFGRESQVEAVWKKLALPHLLGIIGPSGAGKSSFLRAGLLPALPDGWRSAICTPGERPLVALAQALVPDLSGDEQALSQLVRFEESDVAVEIVSRWKGSRPGALIIVDQFEELFTLNPAEVQTRFAETLGRLALEADVHVLLSMRDDFLMHCQGQLALTPLFSDLTALPPPTGSALRRALVQPALRCGYRFEDDNLADEMLAEVRQERGALPLLAFAVSRLWEKRDKERGLLTREAYEEIGGVAGALAQHAERTLEKIGAERQPLMRELFRNLVTAHGTRAVRGWEELLEVFDDRPAAEAILRELVDARLLTSYEEPGEDESDPVRRVEIIHESLLSAWPRLVRWRTQDEDSAQLRDQLRMVAQMWEERGHPDDLLWTGTSYGEFRVWRERYPGGLSAKEQEFTDAMIRRAGRRQRQRRLALAVSFALLLAVVGVFGWLRSEAVAEARRAEASQLVTLGSVELESDRTAALAHALASLERADSPDGRQLALQALWRGPSGFALPPHRHVWGLDFSPDGRWLAGGGTGGERGARVYLWSADGHAVRELPFSDENEPQEVMPVRFGPDSDLLFTAGSARTTVKLWSVPEAQLIRSMDIAGHAFSTRLAGAWAAPLLDAEAKRMVSSSLVSADSSTLLFQLSAIDQGEPRLLNRLEIEGVTVSLWTPVAALEPTGNRLAYGVDKDKGSEIFLVDLAKPGRQPEHLVGRHDTLLGRVAFHPDGETLATIDQQGEIGLWSLTSGKGEPHRRLQSVGNCFDLRFDRYGRHLAATSEGTAHVWDLAAPPDADPMVFRTGSQVNAAAFHPAGGWIATSGSGAAIWPLGRLYPRVLRGHTQPVVGIAFGPKGDWVASASGDGTVRVWPLDPASAERHRVVYKGENLWEIRVSPDGENLLTTSPATAEPLVVPVAGGEERPLLGFVRASPKVAVAFGPHGRLVAVGGGWNNYAPEAKIRVWDLDSDEVLVLEPGDGKTLNEIAFTPDGGLVSASNGGDLRLWDLASGTFRVLRQSAVSKFALSRDGRRLLGIHDGKASLHDLEDGSVRELVAHGDQIIAVALHPDGVTAVTASFDGVIRVGPLTGEEPHLLLGHEGRVRDVAVSPDGRWIASAGGDSTVRLWPMPEGVPFHTLPYEEFLDRLRALTNVRIVEDEQSGTGYRLGVSAFPGWETVPTW